MSSSDLVVTTEQGLRIQGRIAFGNVLLARQQGEHCLSRFPVGKGEIAVDLSALKDEDASSFSLLLCLMRAAKQKQNTLCFTHTPLSLVRMRKMFGLTDLIEMK